MKSRRILAGLGTLFGLSLLLAQTAPAAPFAIRSRSAILVDMTAGKVLYEQNADAPIAPASITKVLTLFIAFDAIREGRAHADDEVFVSARAANTGGSRMGLRAGTRVTLGELIKGAAVVSGNDACVAIAEYLAGDVDAFVRRMNAKARELGMYNTLFMTPNGLPAKGQLTTARDIAKLSIAYLRRYPESLSIHSMTSYTYQHSTHSNANRLLGRCLGVDGLKTGFVCASGYNISATARRGDTRLLAVVMGAQTPGIRLRETEKLIEAGFHSVQRDTVLQMVDYRSDPTPDVQEMAPSGRKRAKAGARKASTLARGSCGVSQKARVAEDSCADPVVKKAGSSGKAGIKTASTGKRLVRDRNALQGSDRVEAPRTTPRQTASKASAIGKVSAADAKKAPQAKAPTATKTTVTREIKKSAKTDNTIKPAASSTKGASGQKPRSSAPSAKKQS